MLTCKNRQPSFSQAGTAADSKVEARFFTVLEQLHLSYTPHADYPFYGKSDAFLIDSKIHCEVYGGNDPACDPDDAGAKEYAARMQEKEKLVKKCGLRLLIIYSNAVYSDRFQRDLEECLRGVQTTFSGLSQTVKLGDLSKNRKFAPIVEELID